MLLLTGTPALSRPIELYTQINALRVRTLFVLGFPHYPLLSYLSVFFGLLQPGLFGTLQHYGLRYCEGKKGRWGWEYKGAANLVELHLLLKKFCMIRRMKSEVLTMLAPKTRTVILADVNDKELARALGKIVDLENALQESISDETTTTGPGGGGKGGGSGRSALSKQRQAQLFELYQKTGEAKLKASCQYITDLVSSGVSKFLVFAHHQTVLDGLEQCLKTLKVKYFRIDGSTPVATRQSGVESFQKDPAMRVALLSITAGGTGITLTAASLVVFAELYWTPALLMQAEDRVHRIGTCLIVSFCFYFVCR